jgi:putative ABC transport system permease protein
VVGCGLLAGEALPFVGWLAGWFGKLSAPRKLANSHLRHPTSRHRWAVAGLLCAVSMTGGMAILVGSFEVSVGNWIQHTLQADLYLTSDANQNASANNHVSAEALQRITTHPAVTEWDAFLIEPVQAAGGMIRLAGADLGFAKRHELLMWLTPPDASAFDAAQNAGLCFVSESYCARHKAGRGDTVLIPTPTGVKSLRIAGVYTEYGDEKGVVMVERSHMQQWFQTGAVTTLSLLLKADTDAEAVRAELRQAFPGLSVYTNAHLRKEVMRIFQQTFAITYALEGIGVLVALAGLGITLASVLAERRAELTTLRSLGMAHSEIAGVAAWEGSLLAATGTAGGLLSSLGLGLLLVFVINKQTFGWTLQMALPWKPLLLLALLIPASGAAVAWSVGRWGADLPADREE